MIKKVIKNLQGEITNGASFESEAIAQAWLALHNFNDTSKHIVEDHSLSQVEQDNVQAIENRVMEYPSVQEMLHILADHGLASQEWSDLQTARQAVKTKYPKS